MAYKTILLSLNEIARLPQLISVARDLGVKFGAHIAGLYIIPSLQVYADSGYGVAPVINDVIRNYYQEHLPKVRKEFETSVEEPERQAYGEIAKIRFAKFGTSVYPDATFTLRLAFGTVKGIDDIDPKIPAWTTMAEAFEHEAAHGGQEPWKLPRSWHDRKSKLDLATPLNFASRTACPR